MMMGVFCRVNHPMNWGNFPGRISGAPEGQQSSVPLDDRTGAHGYVTLIVRCSDRIEMDEVRGKLIVYYDWPGRNDTWYSGSFDLIAVIQGAEMFSEVLWSVNLSEIVMTPSVRSVGDNRAVAFLDAKDIL